MNPDNSTLKKRTKLRVLVAVFDRFHASLKHVLGESAEAFIFNWRSNRFSYVEAMPDLRPSQLAAGLEQGLRELPLLFQSVEPLNRMAFYLALREAIRFEYPEFLELQDVRLSKVIRRGRISSESEFMLVRHAIDIMEGQSLQANGLAALYRLVDAFEARGRRGA